MRETALIRSLSFAFLPGRATARYPADDGVTFRADEILAASVSDEETLLRGLESSLEGLEIGEAEARLALVGPNRVADSDRPGVLGELWDRARNPLNALLLSLALISYFLGDANAAILILIIVVLAIAMAFIQEHRSNDAAAKLREVVKLTASVKRRGSAGENPPSSEFHEILVERLAPGDIVRLSAGDIIPADLRLLKAKDLFVNQSALSGEALPAEKSAKFVVAADLTPLTAPNICLMGTSVVSGFATGVIVQTGSRTYYGQLATRIAGRREQTSFDKGVNRFIRLMLCFMLVLAPSVFLINGFLKGDWLAALGFGLAVAVGLTPELLPMIVTVNLAKGAIAMAKKRVIVKRLNAIQNFGAMDVLCTDKTGTLTQNRISLSLYLDVDDKPDTRVLQYAYLNSRCQSGLKSLIDAAVLEHVERAADLQPPHGVQSVDEIPFDFFRKRLSVIVSGEDQEARAVGGGFARLLRRWVMAPLHSDDPHLLICKGAVEETLSCCSYFDKSGRISNLNSTRRRQILERARELNEDGLRLVAVAYKEIRSPKRSYSIADERELVFLGFLAFLDPPKETVRDALDALKSSGVAIRILTGDNEVITRKICREVGIDAARIALGPQIERMTDTELATLVEEVTIFAKLSPDHKARIIGALHARGHVVGFLGDGINDSLALKAADVGISVDTAVDIAKESADIVLLEKNLLVLQQGVVEGRRVFGNIVKYIKMGASSNFGSMLSVLGASLFVPFLPMLPIQVLTMNLLYDSSQTAIPTDNVDKEYLATPRQWDIDNLFKFMMVIGPISSIFDYTTFYVLTHAFDGLQNPSLFQTGWFVESLLSQTLIIHVIRTAKTPFLHSRPSTTLIVTSLVVCAVGVALPFTSLGQTLKFVPLPSLYWPILACTLLLYGMLTQLVKLWFVRRWGM